MSIVGSPTHWAGLIDSLVPDILRLVVASWENMTPPAADAREDNISTALCRVLRQNREARGLMFQIDTQQVELDPAAGEDVGRLDISFRPLIPREDIYFCLECKRLNVMRDCASRSYAYEYVAFGLFRFVSGQYASRVMHGGMLAYVLSGDASEAIKNVEANLRRKHADLGMKPPGVFMPSSVLRGDDRARETYHARTTGGRICVHHLFMARIQV